MEATITADNENVYIQPAFAVGVNIVSWLQNFIIYVLNSFLL